VSADSEFEIEIVLDTATLINSVSLESASSVLTLNERYTEATISLLRESWRDLYLSVDMINQWLEVLGISSNKVPRSSVDLLLREIAKARDAAHGVLDNIRDGTTQEEKDVYLRKLTSVLEQQENKNSKQVDEEDSAQKEIGDVEQKEEEGGKQNEDEESEQKEDEEPKQNATEEVEERSRKDNERGQNKDVKDLDHEDAKHKEREVAEQQKREEAIAIATSYAEQDRYDSCSDSDGE
jgi:hypothetical protein